jgi:xanthine/CO dehydrogenase XdhC/CoxF family maturation factor
MKQWLETRQVLDRLAELLSEGRTAAMATVVRVRGSAYRHEGAKMLVAHDGSTTGNVSGGCLEADVREVAMQVLSTGARARKEYCASADEVSAWDLGVGCEGMVDILIEPVSGAADVWQAARTAMRAYEPFAICTDFQSGERFVVTRDAVCRDGRDGSDGRDDVVAAARALSGVSSGIHTVAGREVFIDVFTPPPQLLIVSAGEDARPLARFAAEVGFRVTVADRRPGLLDARRFPAGVALIECSPADISARVPVDNQTYAVVMTHNYADDREYVSTLLATEATYIGLLGPRQRTDRIITELSMVGQVNTARLYGPVGLDIGTDGAEQVALSVIGEILAVRSGRRPMSLRERGAPIHSSFDV